MIAKLTGLPLNKIFGDSQVIINWARGKYKLSTIELSHWCSEITDLIQDSADVDISHVFREHNPREYCLSKDALLLNPSLCAFSEFYDNSLCSSGIMKLF